MPLDPRIAMGFQSPQFESPVNMMGNMMKLKSMQQQNALAEQQMGDLTLQRNRAAALDAAYKGAYNPQTGEIDYNTIAGRLAEGGQGTAIPGLLKTRDETLKARYDQAESRAKAFIQEGNMFQSELQNLSANDPSAPALMAQYILGHHSPNSITGQLLKEQGITPQQSLAALENAVKTGKFGEFLQRSQMGANEWYKANAPKFTQVDSGGSVYTQQIPGLGGPATEVPGSRVTKTLSPAERAKLDAETETGNYSEESRNLMAGLVAQGFPLPIPLGRGSKSDALKNDIYERAGRISQGLSPTGKPAPTPASKPGSAPAVAPAVAPAASAVDVAANIGNARQDQQSRAASLRYYSSGRGNQIITSLNTAVDHLDTLSDLATALGNGDVGTFNRIGQAYKKEFGQDAPTNLDAAKVIIAREVLKAITASGGSVMEADELQSTMDKARSPQQLVGVVDTLQKLLAGQLESVGTQYKITTNRTNFEERLSDRTKRVLGRNNNAEGGDAKRKALLDKYKD